jgi:peptide-methionine (S)-S-oxide reductase
VQIDYNPEVVSYEQLLDVFWDGNAGSSSIFSKQYNSIIFYHNDEQKELAVASYEKQKEMHGSVISTAIVPFTKLYLAEDYHQKFYLQQYDKLMSGFTDSVDSFEAFVNSTAAARLNGYVGGYGDTDTLARDIDKYGLTMEGKEKLLEIVGRGIRPGCAIDKS